ncbi:hypothetical protein [Streptomyces sp. HUAS TT7]|uniref:hypothetical protein n=1 Tax=Streptomyces sp. HUAS TT7 TaxID=3447507 RepID=UPI003F6576A9
MAETTEETAGRDPYAYRYVVEGRVRAARYTGPLAEAEGRMGIDRGTAELTIRVHDAGQHGVLRREVVEALALDGYGVRTRRVYADLLADRLDRHALTIVGDPLKVARFAADLPGLLAVIEAAAARMLRQLATWLRDSAHGQRWTDQNGTAAWRCERQHWRRVYIRHLARYVALARHDAVTGANAPDWSENWIRLAPALALAHATGIDTEAVRDHMTEALLYANAVHAEPVEVEEAAPARVSRYATVYDAIHAPVEFNDEIGDVVTTYGPAADWETEMETADAVAVEEDQEVTAAAVEALAELADAAPAPQLSASPAARPVPSRARTRPRIVIGRRRYGSIDHRARLRDRTRPLQRASAPPARARRTTPASRKART